MILIFWEKITDLPILWIDECKSQPIGLSSAPLAFEAQFSPIFPRQAFSSRKTLTLRRHLRRHCISTQNSAKGGGRREEKTHNCIFRQLQRTRAQYSFSPIFPRQGTFFSSRKILTLRRHLRSHCISTQFICTLNEVQAAFKCHSNMHSHQAAI